jgi:hypothetical protein
MRTELSWSQSNAYLTVLESVKCVPNCPGVSQMRTELSWSQSNVYRTVLESVKCVPSSAICTLKSQVCPNAASLVR